MTTATKAIHIALNPISINVWCAVCSAQCVVCSVKVHVQVQYVLYSMQYIYSVQCLPVTGKDLEL